MLVRRADESIENLLRRLEAALVRAFEHDEYVDEINGEVPHDWGEAPGELPARPRATPRYTSKQGQYLAFIYYYSKIHGVPPSEADLRHHVRVSPPAVHRMVVSLEDRGLIVRARERARSIRLLVDREELPDLE